MTPAVRRPSAPRLLPALALPALTLPALAAALLLGLAPLPPAAAEDAGKPVGDALYGASFKDLRDEPTSLGRFKNRVVVMYFWATWCVPCRVETPNLVKLAEEYRTKDVTVIGLALDNGDKVRDFVRENNITYPVFYGGREAVQLGKAFGNSEGAIPFTVVIDQQGRLLRTFKGDLPNAELEKIINPLVG